MIALFTTQRLNKHAIESQFEFQQRNKKPVEKRKTDHQLNN